MSKVKIGFIDYYLDEWHANNYPAWIKKASDGKMEVAYAYGKITSPLTGMTSAQWCEKYGIALCESIEELVDKSDCLIVLSPDNCEMHEELCQIPLRSGKLTYVDKTFAPDLTTAQRIFVIAESSGTHCYSTSALRFAEEYKNIDRSSIEAINCWGGGGFETYSIHQLEPLVMLMGAAAKRVQYLPAKDWYQLQIEFEDGRYGTLSGYAGGSPFMMNISHRGAAAELINVQSDFFHQFIVELVDFFRTGKPKVSHQDTLRIMAIRGAGLEAMKKPGEWVSL